MRNAPFPFAYPPPYQHRPPHPSSMLLAFGGEGALTGRLSRLVGHRVVPPVSSAMSFVGAVCWPMSVRGKSLFFFLGQGASFASPCTTSARWGVPEL